jgi:hypothetical protein
LSFCPPVSQHRELRRERAVLRSIGLDVHRDFCEAIWEHGRTRRAGRIASDPRRSSCFPDSLGAEDQVAIEATSDALAIA